MTVFIKKYKAPIIAAALILAVLTIVFVFSGKPVSDKATNDSAVPPQSIAESTAPSTVAQQTTAMQTTEAVSTDSNTESATQKSTEANTVTATEKSEHSELSATQSVTDKYKTDPVPAGKPKPVEPQEQTTADDKIYCTFSISCATILDNLDDIDQDLKELIPSDGWILKPEKVEVNDGESVFDVLVRVCKDKNIHMEYSWTPIYNSSYIEGIANIYEFDCGDQSGWIYKVNSWAPNYGCSRYVVNNNDVIEWKYTCNLGKDV